MSMNNILFEIFVIIYTYVSDFEVMSPYILLLIT